MLLDKDIIQKPPNSRIIQQKLKFEKLKSFNYFRFGNNTSKTSISSDFIVEFDLRLLAKL